ncbi:MAG: SpoIIIAH-like family protein [Bacilli bacterium]|nr:SpoIIIAH-like family protein [Bacilli bacterium]
MINKQSLWFITLFSLIIILGIYYVSMPSDALTVFSGNTTDTSSAIEVTESDIIIAMKVEEEEKILSQMDEAQKVLLDETATADDKNDAYKTLQLLNSQKGKTLEIERIIKNEFNFESCVKIEGNKINITISSKNDDIKTANSIISRVQKLYDSQMYITVKFQ